MLQVSNISPTYRVSVLTGDAGGQNRPAVINLGPGDTQYMMQSDLSNWSMGPRQDLAQYIQMGTIRLLELDSAHHGIDLGNKPVFTATDNDLEATLNTAISFRIMYNGHLASSVHTTPDITNVSVLADPTDLAELLVFIADLQAKYALHIPLAGAHPNPDLVNVLVPVVASDLPTSILALREIFGMFSLHKKRMVTAGTAPLTPNAVIAY